MANIDVYKQYFSAECTYNGVARHGAVVWLNAESEDGIIRYEAGVSFFPHRDEEDFGISYDAYASKVIFSDKGRRSKKRDAAMLELMRETADACAQKITIPMSGKAESLNASVAASIAMWELIK